MRECVGERGCVCVFGGEGGGGLRCAAAAWWRQRENRLDRFAFTPDLFLESAAVWEGKGSTCIPISFYWQPDKQGPSRAGFQRGCRAPCCVAQYRGLPLMAVPPNNGPERSQSWPARTCAAPALFLGDGLAARLPHFRTVLFKLTQTSAVGK